VGTAPANINERKHGNQALSSGKYFYFHVQTFVSIYCSCSRVMPKTSFQLIQLWRQLHGLPLYPQNTNTTTLQDDREIPKNINDLLPYSSYHHQKENWRASARTSVCQQMLLCFLRWLTDPNTLAMYKQLNLGY